ncbi:hypothetical protein OJAV_G00201500 [Oryzias javanicus]|uniref:Palmdelphin n=1 Tax=Oryzias javanicus TaxID=123683 RepID=A0A437C8U6_ORYJA|nr:hypothetical protein OJAV_G00201500 [Oryzias javanicus]
MEEAELLKERLQAITDKRRIQEDIAKKRRQIEEEKLKLQYIKKKALREQWLMDGLSQQSEEEQEAMRLQAEGEQQQSDELQQNILRIEKEIEALEMQELSISANEEVVLKRLKEVERTAEEIIRKATLAEKETDGKELKGDNFISVSMETPEQSNPVMECEAKVTDSPEQEEDFSEDKPFLLVEPDSSVTLMETVSSSFSDMLTSTCETDEADRSGSTVCSQMPFQCEVEDLALEPDLEELNRNESVPTSVSDTPSSADIDSQKEAHYEKEDTAEHDPEHVPEPEEVTEPEHDPKLQESLQPVEDFEMGDYSEPEPDLDPQLYFETEHDPELDLYSIPYAGTDIDGLCPEDDDGYQNLEDYSNEEPEEHEILYKPPFQEESALEHCIREEVMSDESCHDLDEMDECLRVEIEENLSDSEADDKWRTIFSSSINKEDDDSYLDSLQLSAQELFVQKAEEANIEEEDLHNFEEVSFEVPQVTEVLEQPKDLGSFPTAPLEVKYNPLSFQSLSKISEDENENGKDSNHNHSKHTSAGTTKKLPKDFCVIQETKSENVSTEHVDFQMARKQWREMEEQMKNKIILPATKQPVLRSSYSFMHTPVRNIERAHNKAHDLENLNLVGFYPQTQFSPCSEDSGLDDSSYRSPCDDLETPVEREIRISVEREEHFKRERGFTRMGKSTDCAPSRGLPRSISTPLTPSFIITSSPTEEPLKHEMSANNVIILDPTNDTTSSSTLAKDNMSSWPGGWKSEDHSSNLIILETSNVIIRSASEFSLNKSCEQPEEKMFLNNPFFKLRSRSTISLVDEEIKMVKQREEELRKERANLYGKDGFSTENVLTHRMDTLAFDKSVDVPVKCKSSPSSPMKTAYRMDRSVLSCDHRFPEDYAGGRRKSAMALRWEAGEFIKNN